MNLACMLTDTAGREEHHRMNLASMLTDTAGRHGDRTALKLDDVEVTYAQLDEASARVAALLAAKGAKPGDRVGIMLPNVPYFAVAYYGVLRAGMTVVPMNVLLKGREVSFYLEDPEAEIMFAWHDFAEAAHEGADEGRRRRRGHLRRPRRVREAPRRARAGRRRGGHRRRRHRGHPLHLGHHRQAEGRGAHPLEPPAQRRDRGGHPGRDDHRRHPARAPCPCSTPSGRRAR
ncbi:MAG: AMP-binding protein [Thermoleophilaceae bacterium]